jgi:hypothetical protein
MLRILCLIAGLAVFPINGIDMNKQPLFKIQLLKKSSSQDSEKYRTLFFAYINNISSCTQLFSQPLVLTIWDKNGTEIPTFNTRSIKRYAGAPPPNFQSDSLASGDEKMCGSLHVPDQTYLDDKGCYTIYWAYFNWKLLPGKYTAQARLTDCPENSVGKREGESLFSNKFVFELPQH